MSTNGASATHVSWKTALDTLTSVVMIGAAVTLVWFHLSSRGPSTPQPKLPSDPVSLEAAVLKGSPSAAAVMIVFSDFECPYCASFARDTMPHLEREYIAPGRLQVAHRYLPLDKHQHAFGAARAAECAGRQGQFWAMYDRLFSPGVKLDEPGLHLVAGGLELDNASYRHCLGDQSSMTAVSRDLEHAKALGLANTPAFLLGSRTSNGRVQVSRAFYGSRPIEEFRAEIERAVHSLERGWIDRLFNVFAQALRQLDESGDIPLGA